jgi:phosphonoacetate hydrolase
MPASAALLDQLTSPDMAHRVEGIVQALGAHRYRYRTSVGEVTWRWDRTTGSIDIQSSSGVNLLENASTDRFIGVESERSAYASRPGDLAAHGRPYAYESLAQLFDDPKTSSELLVLAPGFPLHGNTGNHGSLTSVQSRGLCIAAGPGIQRNGWIDGHGRVIDVAPTIATLLGTPALRTQDGQPLANVLSEQVANRVIAVVFDGANLNLVADAIANDELPTLGGLLTRGSGLRRGIISSFPTVTLPNHLSLFTGVHPGRHGVINNVFRDRTGTQIDLLQFGSMIHTQDWVSPEVETLHELVRRWRPDAFTSASYEYADRGATWSTFGEFRSKRRPFYATADMARATADAASYESNEQYRFMSRIDESSVGSAIEQWRGPSITGHDLPTLQLVNFSLTDDTGHHVGPFGDLARCGLIDTDRRLGRLLDAVEAAGAFEKTAVVVVSDHGMEQCDPTLLDSPFAELSPLLAAHGYCDVGDNFLFQL